MPSESVLLIEAGAILDADAVASRPGAVAIRGGRVFATGPPAAVRSACGSRPIERVIMRPHSLVLPALVNGHAHLDLTSIGPRPFCGSFLGWVERVIRDRPTDDSLIERVVIDGLTSSRTAGVGWLADIAGSAAAVRARFALPAEKSVPGASFLECFGIGAAQDAAVARAIAEHRLLVDTLPSDEYAVVIGLQPHAPYSAGRSLYGAAANCAQVASTHLAETREELEFVSRASGPFAELLRKIGKWDDSIVPSNSSPFAHLGNELDSGRWIVAHGNYLDDTDIELLKGRGRVSVAYCPIASDYFGHEGHRYRELLDAGINVCLGTDSVLCQPADEPQPLGIMPQMRHLYGRDGTAPRLLLEMATTRGMRALGLPPGDATLGPEASARLIAVPFDPRDPTDPLAQVLDRDEPVEAL